MRKHLSCIWLGLLFLVVVCRALPFEMRDLSPTWPTDRTFVIGTWLTLALVVSEWRSIRIFVPSPIGPVLFDAVFLSVVGPIAAIQTWPEAAKWGVLDVTARTIGDGMLYVTFWPFLLISFAYVVAPSSKLVAADHPVQFRDRVNASKGLIGVAGLVLLYRLMSYCIQ